MFLLACQTSGLVYLHRYIFGLIKPELAKEWELSNTQLGMLDSAFSGSYSIFQFPTGVLADVVGVQLVLSGLIFLWCIALAMHAWAPSMWAMWLARISMGAGQSGAFACQAKLTRSWFPLSMRTIAQGWIGVFFARFGGFGANIFFAALLLGVLGVDWRSGVYLCAGIGLVHGMLFFIFYRNSPRQHPWANAAEANLVEGAETAKPRPSIRQLLRETRPRSLLNLAVLNVQSILSTAADNIFSNWIPTFLVAVHGLKFTEMGLFGALPLLGGAIGGVAGGFLNDWLIRATGNRRWSRTGVGLAGKGIAGVVMLVALLFYDNPYAFCLMLFFVKFFADTALTTTWGSVTDIGGRASASVFAFNNSVAGIGSFFAPLLYGWIADETGGWRMVFVTAAVIYFACALSWLAFNCTIPVVGKREQAKDR